MTVSIRELDEDTIRQIAAGEVVERPASVVKELIENSLDADASRIDVAVEAGGTERIAVADDGIGMDRDELALAVKEHTTSKLTDPDALAGRIETLGFRGEALYAIGAVSRMTVTTKPRGGDRGARLTVDHGEVGEVEPAGRPAGTTVEVTELFAETPARREFLKTEATEYDHVNRIVTRYALANPDVAVSLAHDGREAFATAGRGDLEATLLSVYGREVAEGMIAVEGSDLVSGYVSHPETTRSTREYLATYVNGRFVTSSVLRDAILEAYGNQLAPDRYPFAVLFLDLPAGAVDVNVHPRKLEVRLSDPETVKAEVTEAVRDALLEHGLLRSGAPRGRSAPEEAPVEPEASADGTGEPGPTQSASGPSFPRGASVDDTGPRTPEDRRDTDPSRSGSGGRRRPAATAPPEGTVDDPADGDGAGGGDGRLHDRGRQVTLEAEPTDGPIEFDRLPGLRVLGQLHETYVVAATDDGLVLIDQHAADERVNYERLKRRLGDTPDTQALAEPVDLELTAREAILFPAYADALSELGFRADRTGERTVTVRAVPAVLDATIDPERLRDVLGELVGGAPEATSVDARRDALLADLACYPAVTGNTGLTEGSIRDLLEALDGCENPYACPHGRPVVVEIDREELEARFERDYPGHADRRPET